MYLKLNVTKIIGHSWIQDAEYTTFVDKIPEEIFDCKIGAYKYDYDNGQFIELSESEKINHPLRKANKKKEFDFIRKQKLSETDWILLSDSKAKEDCKSSFVTYRQTLRDMPDQIGFDPENPQWPEIPVYEKI